MYKWCGKFGDVAEKNMRVFAAAAALLASLCTVPLVVADDGYLELLGVSTDELNGLDDGQLKKLYKRRALELHPDKSDHPDAQSRFARLQEAYEALKDPETRSFFSRFGSSGVWREVMEYTNDRLQFTRQGWVRTRRGMQIQREQVRIRDDFAHDSSGAVLPLHGKYMRDALARHDGVWVIYVCNHHEDQRGCAQLSATIAAFARHVGGASVDNFVKVAAINTAVDGNDDIFDVSTQNYRGGPYVVLLPPTPHVAVGTGGWDRVADYVAVAHDPHLNLPLRLRRVARWLKASQVPVVDLRGGVCHPEDETCALVDEAVPMATVLLEAPTPRLLAAAREARAKYRGVMDVAVATCENEARAKACSPAAGGFPRVGVEQKGSKAFWLELADDKPVDDREAAARLTHALSGVYAARRSTLTEGAPKRITVSGLENVGDGCKLSGFDGTYERVDGLYFGKPAWRRRTAMLRWHPGSTRARGIGGWLLTDHETEDRAWGFLEADVMLPYTETSGACWTFHCHEKRSWICQPHVTVAAA